MKEIKMWDIDNIQVGQHQDLINGTGCTVILCKKGACAGVDVRGGGPATRETDLLNPKNMIQKIHGVILSGGSAFGLDAASGVMKYLEEKQCGFNVGKYYIPIVCGASLFDLNVGNGHVRPNLEMGYQACLNSENNNYLDGNYGAGTGASVGKLLGFEHAMKSGQGMYGVDIDGIKICSLVAVNACGNIKDLFSNDYLAGVLVNDKIIDPLEIFDSNFKNHISNTNTTIACIVTNAKLDKSQCNKIASIAHNAYARTIFPVHTMSDGDTIFVLSTNEIEAAVDMIGVMAVHTLENAINKAVISSDDAYGLISAKSLRHI